MQTEKKTNEDWVRSLSRKDLAGLLIRKKTEPDFDEGIDGEMHQCGESDFYITSDGLEFWEDYESALEHECWWLAQEPIVCG